MRVVTVTSDDETPGGAEVSAAPIFVTGMMPRTGTHFLTQLLCLHPACGRSPIAEDALLTGMPLLARYVTTLHTHWEAVMAGANPGDPALLYQCLGQGLLEFLWVTKQRVLAQRVAKTAGKATTVTPPSLPPRLVARNIQVAHLDAFFTLFPQAQLLLLIRDGRAVVESSVRTFQDLLEAYIRTWARAAETVLRFDRNPQHAGRSYLIVRYEDLHTQTASEMRRILQFLHLDEARYDFQAALQLPVIGSSTFKRGAGAVHWMPVVKTPDFTPLTRAAHWRRAQHERFNWLAGEVQQRLGYTLQRFPAQRFCWTLWNRGLDLRWALGTWLSRLKGVVARSRRHLHSTF